MRVTITGADGFIGKNLAVRLTELGAFDVRRIVRGSDAETVRDALSNCDAVVHLAGVNRPDHPSQFMSGNRDATQSLADAIVASGQRPHVLFASSTKAGEATPYGLSKKAAEDVLAKLGQDHACAVSIFRLPNVFGKWSRPDYNSAVATFCHRVSRGLPIDIHDGNAPLSLLYVDDLVDTLIDVLRAPAKGCRFRDVTPLYDTTVGKVADLITGFHKDRANNTVAAVGTGLVRALYSTYVSFLPREAFSYNLAPHADSRGLFAEVLRTGSSGQFSFLTAQPGVTRGGHYHHTKIEKFVVVQGEALFRFRHIVTGDTYELSVSSRVPAVVETVPGWAHDITNVGSDVLVSLLWANEVFDNDRPDTVAAPVT
jgi:UDP-2-acetamido-2,6-beta-L-arabino-hexul-4-ose reductase